MESSDRNLRSIPYRKHLRTRPKLDKYTEIIRWCIGHVDAYRIEQRSVFFANLKAFATA